MADYREVDSAARQHVSPHAFLARDPDGRYAIMEDVWNEQANAREPNRKPIDYGWHVGMYDALTAAIAIKRRHNP